MLKRETIFLTLRLFLETCAYYNSRFLFCTAKLSPGLIIYTTHSIMAVVLLFELIKYKSKLNFRIKEKTGISFKRLIYTSLALSPFINLKSLIRFACFVKLSDSSIISLSCTSILFTKYCFKRKVRITKRDKSIIFISTIGLLIIIINERCVLSCLGIVFTAFLSSMYNVLYKRVMVPDLYTSERIERLMENKKLYVKYFKKKNEDKNSIIEPTNTDIKDCRPFMHEKISDEVPKNSLQVDFKDSHVKTNPSYKLESITFETTQTLYRAYYYILISSLVTMIFFWPIIFINFTCQLTKRALIHVGLSFLFSTILTFYHFVLISTISPLFAILSNLLFKVLILIIHFLVDGLCLDQLAGLIVIIAVFMIKNKRIN